MIRSLTIGLAICISSLLLSCGKHSLPPSPDTFCYNEPDGLLSLDPAMAGYRSAIWTSTHLFNGLVELGPNSTIMPCIARQWETDPSGLEWTFTLRTDVWFHDDPCFGPATTRRVTAADVRYSIERICDARTKSTGLWVFRTRIDGAQEFFENTKRGIDGSIRGIRIVNDSVVRIRLTKPFAPFLAILTMPYACIIPREAVQRYGAEFGRHPVGTGPFAFARWKPDIELSLTRNPRYFKVDSVGTRLPYLKTVAITFLRDPKSEFLEFTHGHLDFVSSIDGSFESTILRDNGTLQPPYDVYQLYRAAAQSVEYYGILLDTTYAAAKAVPLARQRLLRQALNYAIDRHRIVTYLLHGRGIPAQYGVLPPTMPGFSDSVRGYRYDPDLARRLLAQAGYPNGSGLPPLLLQLGNSERTASVAEAVQAMWHDVGINVELRQVDFPQHLSMVRAGELAMWRTSWIGDYPDPENFLALFVSANCPPNGPNTTRVRRTDLDSLYEVARTPRLSAPERYALYHRMERIVLDECPWVFLYYNVNMWLAQPNVRGLTLDGSERLTLERVFKDPSVAFVIHKQERAMMTTTMSLICTMLVAFVSISTVAPSTVSAKPKHKHKHSTSRKHRKSSCSPAARAEGKRQAMELVRTRSEELSRLVGIPTSASTDTKDLADRIIAGDGELEAGTISATASSIDEGEDIAELEKEDDVSVDIEAFRSLWLKYVDDGPIETTAGGIEKQKMIDQIMDWLGTRYDFGGTARTGIDCSAFTRTVYSACAGVELPRTAAAQIGVGSSITRRSQLEFGDLIFFHTRRHAYVSHVGIYLGDNLFAHASSRYGVTISSLESTYYSKRLIGARRMTEQDIARLAHSPDTTSTN